MIFFLVFYFIGLLSVHAKDYNLSQVQIENLHNENADVGTSACEDEPNVQALKGLIDSFVKKNPKMRAIISCLRANKFDTAKNIIKNMTIEVKSTKKFTEKDSSFGTPRLDVSIQAGLNTVFEIQEVRHFEKELLYTTNSSIQTIEEAEKITLEFLKNIIEFNLSIEFLKYMEVYILECRMDAKEAEAREKHNDISVEEAAEFKTKLAEAEVAYEKLKSEIEASKNFIDMYYPKKSSFDHQLEAIDLPQAPEEIVLDFSLYQLENINVFEQVELGSAPFFKSKYALKKAESALFKNIAGFTPYIKLGGKFYLYNPIDRLMSEKDEVLLEIGIDLSPKRFFETYQAQCSYEFAKYNFLWEKRKYELEKVKLNNRLTLARADLNKAKLNLEAKKLAFQAASSHYIAGSIPHKKLSYARTDYYYAFEKYYKASKELSDSILEYMRLTGALRTFFLKLIEKEVGE